VLPDRYSGMLYFKLAARSTAEQSGAQFKVVTFDDEINFGEEIFVLKNTDWHRSSIGYPTNANNPIAHLDTAPAYFYGLEIQSDHGAVVINNQGRIVGFVNQNGDLLPNIYITRILPTLLSSNKIVYLSLGVEGLFNHEQPIVVDGERKSGFLITKVRVIPSGASDPTLKKGDIILEINGREIETDNVLWYNKDATARVKVWRMREVLEIESKVVEVN
ncbi:S1C family serine protease, partial [Patescibacteria group bacterium]|nr:S1C family serine protease [Patescibacteria group bacterium]